MVAKTSAVSTGSTLTARRYLEIFVTGDQACSDRTALATHSEIDRRRLRSRSMPVSTKSRGDRRCSTGQFRDLRIGQGLGLTQEVDSPGEEAESLDDLRLPQDLLHLRALVGTTSEL